MDEIKRQEYERAFKQLKQTYIKRLNNSVRIIDNILQMGALTPFTHNDILRAQALVHGLAGSGATFGYPEVTEIGHEADQFIDHMVKAASGPVSMDAAQYQHFIALLTTTQKICRDICARARVEMPELANANERIPTDTAHPHILVVDDDKEVSMAIAQGLHHAGMMAQMSATGEDAFYYLGQMVPDLVLIDLSLGDMNGLELLQQIKQNSEFLDVPVILMATRYNEGEEVFAKHAGAAAYIRKPIEVKALMQTVKDVLNGARQNVQSI